MKFIKKKAECVAIIKHGGERLPDWRCPTCGMGIADDYICCPYCRQKVKFNESTIRKEEFKVSLTYKIGENWEEIIYESSAYLRR